MNRFQGCFFKNLLRHHHSLQEGLHPTDFSDNRDYHLVSELYNVVLIFLFFFSIHFLSSTTAKASSFALGELLAWRFTVRDEDAIIHLLEDCFELLVLAVAFVVHYEDLDVGQVLRIVS